MDFFAVAALVSLAAGEAVAVSPESDFLLFLDFAVVELPVAGVLASADESAFVDLEDVFEADESAVAELSTEASAFFDFDDFFVAEESAAGLPVVSAVFDLEDFFVVELSAGAGVSAESVFLLLVDFLAVEESAAAVSSAVAAFFFFFDFAAVVSVWSVVVGVCAACAADAGRRARVASTNRNATSRETYNRLEIRFIFGEFLSPAAHQSLCRTRMGKAGAGDREVRIIAARLFLGELGK